jgi:hypothetical protein
MNSSKSMLQTMLIIASLGFLFATLWAYIKFIPSLPDMKLPLVVGSMLMGWFFSAFFLALASSAGIIFNFFKLAQFKKNVPIYESDHLIPFVQFKDKYLEGTGKDAKSKVIVYSLIFLFACCNAPIPIIILQWTGR